jgi:SAM-dependent methyltransferase
MPIDLASYRARPVEQERIASLLELLPPGRRILEIGARDGYVTRALAERFQEVVALDLDKVDIVHPRIETVVGDVRELDFQDGSFDVVLCAEVLEHVAPTGLRTACNELARVTGGSLLIGVPYKQDLRVDPTRCQHCGRTNPPWGHVNSFDEVRLDDLFPGLTRVRTAWVGHTRWVTNALSAWLMELAGHPWGTYQQDERCIYCGQPVGEPRPRNLTRRVLSAAAERLNRLQRRFTPEQPCWIHCLYQIGRDPRATPREEPHHGKQSG